MFHEFTAYADPKGDGYTEDLVPVAVFDAEDADQALAILREAKFRIVDVVDDQILVA